MTAVSDSRVRCVLPQQYDRASSHSDPWSEASGEVYRETLHRVRSAVNGIAHAVLDHRTASLLKSH